VITREKAAKPGERLCTSPITAQFGVRVEHAVTDDAAGSGEYEALDEACASVGAVAGRLA
jgi:hypothetical protein